MAKNPNCPCKRMACPRHGDCAECRAKHKTSLPSCERPPKKTKKPEALAEAHRNRGGTDV